MPTPYRTYLPDRIHVVCGASPEAIRSSLQGDARWPSGSFEITGVGSPFGYPRDHRGAAVKRLHGTVELNPDQPA